MSRKVDRFGALASDGGELDGSGLGRSQKDIVPYGAHSKSCPYCSSNRTRIVSLYGSTISEALFSCDGCGSTFGWMKAEGRRAHRTNE